MSCPGIRFRLRKAAPGIQPGQHQPALESTADLAEDGLAGW